MNKIKVVGVEKYNKVPETGEFRTSAVDHYRMVSPVGHLNRNDFDVTLLKEIVGLDNRPDDCYSAIGEAYDVLYTSYIDTPKAYSYIRAIQDRYGIKHIMDLDDNVYQIDELNPVYERYNRLNEAMFNIHQVIKDAEYMTVSTEYLKKVLMRFGRRKPIFVVENAIDLKLYDFPFETKKQPDKKTVMVYFGSSTHYSDLMHTGLYQALEKIQDKYKKMFKVKLIGMPVEEIEKNLRSEFVYGKSDFYQWIDLWKKEMTNVDFGIAPLTDTDFNECKSPIKYYEYSACKVPAIYSNVGPYRRTVKEDAGILVENNTESWFRAIDRMIQDPQLREELAGNGYNDVVANHTIDKNAYKWEEVIKEIYGK